jgi:hypothetical protein
LAYSSSSRRFASQINTKLSPSSFFFTSHAAEKILIQSHIILSRLNDGSNITRRKLWLKYQTDQASQENHQVKDGEISHLKRNDNSRLNKWALSRAEASSG